MKQLIKSCSVFFSALVVALIAGCATGTDEGMDTRAETNQTPGAYVDDALITTKVKAAIVNDSRLNPFEINVETYQGNVQLNGFVDTRDDITRAVEVAQGVEGVRSVKNNLQLKGDQYR